MICAWSSFNSKNFYFRTPQLATTDFACFLLKIRFQHHHKAPSSFRGRKPAFFDHTMPTLPANCPCCPASGPNAELHRHLTSEHPDDVASAIRILGVTDARGNFISGQT